MDYYFTGLNLELIERIREIISFQDAAEKAILIPNKYIDKTKLYKYNKKLNRLEEIKDIKAHSF